MSPAPLLDTDRVEPNPRPEPEVSAATKSHHRWRRWRQRRERKYYAPAGAASKRGDAIGTWRERESAKNHRNRRGRNIATEKIRTRIEATQAASRRTLLAEMRSLDGPRPIQRSGGGVGLPDPLRLTVHKLYPAAAAITAGMLLVGRPRPAIILSLRVQHLRASCVSPLGIKFKGNLYPRVAYLPDYHAYWILLESRSSQHGADGCLKQEIREIAKKSFSSDEFQAQE